MPRYSDIDFLLTKNEITNDASVKYDTAAISQSIKNILLTTRGEKLFNSRFGGNLYELVFNDLSPLLLEDKKLVLKSEIELQEPRAIVTSINIEDSGTGYWDVSVVYSPIYDPAIVRNLNLTIGTN